MKHIWIGALVTWLLVITLGISTLWQQQATLRPTIPTPAMVVPDLPVQAEVNTVRLMVAGDIMPGRMVHVYLHQLQDFEYPFKRNLFAGADIVYANLESPLIDNCPLRRDGFKFCSDKRIAQALSKAGITVVNLANNHIGNEGTSGILQTTTFLTNSGVFYTGTDEDVILTRNGIRIGFVGFNDVGSCPKEILCADIDVIQEKVKDLESRVDVVVVQFHWGAEYTNKPSSRQRLLAQTSIDAGADLVVGAHPHWVQTTEYYKGVLIAYSHGNFLFDQQWSTETQQGVVGNYLLSKTGLVQYEFLPIIVDKSYQPRFADEPERSTILNRMGIQ